MIFYSNRDIGLIKSFRVLKRSLTFHLFGSSHVACTYKLCGERISVSVHRSWRGLIVFRPVRRHQRVVDWVMIEGLRCLHWLSHLAMTKLVCGSHCCLVSWFCFWVSSVLWLGRHWFVRHLAMVKLVNRLVHDIVDLVERLCSSLI